MLKTIQSGRGLAALAVAAFHLSIAFADPRFLGHSVFASLTWRGNLGVDFFFVLSGFIMMFAHEGDIGRPGRWRAFAGKRFVRLYPIYWLYTGAFVALVLLHLGSAATMPHNLTDWLSTITLVRFSALHTPIAPARTLFYEIGFYAIFSMLILNRRLGALLFAAWAVLILYLFDTTFSDGMDAFAVYTSTYNLDFMIGMGAYALWRRAGPLPCRAAFSGGLLLIAGTLWCEARGMAMPFFGLLYGLGMGGLIAGAAAWESRTTRKVGLSLLCLLGDASYSIYLTHESVESLFLKIALGHGARHADEHIVYIAVLIASVAAGCVAYKFIEQPLVKACRRLATPEKRAAG